MAAKIAGGFCSQFFYKEDCYKEKQKLTLFCVSVLFENIKRTVTQKNGTKRPFSIIKDYWNDLYRANSNGQQVLGRVKEPISRREIKEISATPENTYYFDSRIDAKYLQCEESFLRFELLIMMEQEVSGKITANSLVTHYKIKRGMAQIIASNINRKIVAVREVTLLQ